MYAVASLTASPSWASTSTTPRRLEGALPAAPGRSRLRRPERNCRCRWPRPPQRPPHRPASVEASAPIAARRCSVQVPVMPDRLLLHQRAQPGAVPAQRYCEGQRFAVLRPDRGLDGAVASDANAAPVRVHLVSVSRGEPARTGVHHDSGNQGPRRGNGAPVVLAENQRIWSARPGSGVLIATLSRGPLPSYRLPEVAEVVGGDPVVL